ncbi:MAG: ATP-binding protein [Deltaproteobacteria bacterium]|nr:ATP-binding protein [Deltaproteobacteria bacterium]MBN2673505.1 ATP-binding protein [Deltaproteobacteria bacterium]
MIKRNMSHELQKCAAEYPAVTILGPRQSGKTTLAQMTFPNHQYVSLEDPDTRRQALRDPRGWLAGISDGVILDEIQRAPELLSYLQGMIDANRKKAGKYVLTGSHQPHVHTAVSQSLAGRTAVLELLPFCIDEVRQYGVVSDIFELIYKGFYPGVHDNDLDVQRFYRSYTSTYLERDLRAQIHLKDLSRFEIFLQLIAGRIGQLVNYSSLSNDVGVSSTTIKDWVSILKASYILFELPPWFANIRKRLVRSSKLYFLDTGLAAWLLGLNSSSQVRRDPLRGALYENLLIVEVLKQMLNQGRKPHLYFFRDSQGNEVDLLLSEAGRSFTAVEMKSSATFQPEFIKGLDVFSKSVPPDVRVDRHVWFNGTDRTTYMNTTVCNPLVHGFHIV